MFWALFCINLRETARKIDLLDGFDILREKSLSGVAERGYTICYMGNPGYVNELNSWFFAGEDNR